MARIRSLKPEFRTSLTVTSWPRDVRLFFALLWGYADDHGRGIDEPRLIKADCFPLDDDITPATIDGWLNLMAETGTVVRYEVAGRRYFAIPGWSEHQKPQHPKGSSIPLPPGPTPPDRTPEAAPVNGSNRSGGPEKPHAAVMKIGGAALSDLTPEGEGEQGGVGGGATPERSGAEPRSAPVVADPEPPRKCPRHIHTPNPPNCGSCGDMRRDHVAWEKRQIRPAVRAPDCPEHPGQPSGRCDRCASEARPSPGLRSLRGA